MDPIKYMFEKLVMIRRTARWLMMLLEFDISFIPQKTIKGQAITDFLADDSVVKTLSTRLYFLDEQTLYIEVEMIKLPIWKMCFDRVVNQKGNRVRAILISLAMPSFPLPSVYATLAPTTLQSIKLASLA